MKTQKIKKEHFIFGGLIVLTTFSILYEAGKSIWELIG
jgi:hypothetical protein